MQSAPEEEVSWIQADQPDKHNGIRHIDWPFNKIVINITHTSPDLTTVFDTAIPYDAPPKVLEV